MILNNLYQIIPVKNIKINNIITVIKMIKQALI